MGALLVNFPYMKRCIMLLLVVLSIGSCAQNDIFYDWRREFVSPQSEYFVKGISVDYGDWGVHDCHTIDIIDSIILIKCAATKSVDKHYIVLDKNRKTYIGDFINYGNGPNEMIGNRYSGYYGNKLLLFSMGENKVMQWDINQTLNTGQVVLTELFDLPLACFAVIPNNHSNKIIVINHANQNYNYSIIDSTGNVEKTVPIYSGINYWTDITYLSDCYALSQDGDKLVFSMTFLPQVNYISLSENTKLTVSTNKRIGWSDIIQKDPGRGLKLYHPRIIPYEDKFVVLSFDEHENTHFHIFDSIGSFIADVKTSENLRDIAFDSTSRLIYGVDVNSNIYTYDINEFIK